MVARLVRAASETPNISNRDDYYPIYHAYGGQSGFIHGMDLKIVYVRSDDGEGNRVFRVDELSRFVLFGWEIVIEPETFYIPNSKFSNTIYLKVDLLNETSEFIADGDFPKGLSNVGEEFPIYGDDLTQNPYGTAYVAVFILGITDPWFGNTPYIRGYKELIDSKTGLLYYKKSLTLINPTPQGMGVNGGSPFSRYYIERIGSITLLRIHLYRIPFGAWSDAVLSAKFSIDPDDLKQCFSEDALDKVFPQGTAAEGFGAVYDINHYNKDLVEFEIGLDGTITCSAIPDSYRSNQPYIDISYAFENGMSNNIGE